MPNSLPYPQKNKKSMIEREAARLQMRRGQQAERTGGWVAICRTPMECKLFLGHNIILSCGLPLCQWLFDIGLLPLESKPYCRLVRHHLAWVVVFISATTQIYSICTFTIQLCMRTGVPFVRTERVIADHKIFPFLLARHIRSTTHTPAVTGADGAEPPQSLTGY